MRVVFSNPPVYGPSSFVMSGAERIDVGGYGAPCVADWDEDGLKDLLIGQFDYGFIRFYKNIGSNQTPQFDGFSYLFADGFPLSVPYG